MGKFTQIFLTLIVGVGLGLGGGKLWLAPLNLPPPRADGAPAAKDNARLPSAITATNALVPPLPQPTSEAPSRDIDAENSQDDSAVLVPASPENESKSDHDASLIPRGPGHFALLDLATAKVGRLNIREGKMERDGDGRFGAFAHNKIIGHLRGRRPRVELLHVGFNRDGRATVVHIRTTENPPIEGVVALGHFDASTQEEVIIPLRRAPKPDPSEPALEIAPPPTQ